MNIIKLSGPVHFLFVLLLSNCLSGDSPSPFSHWALWNIVHRSFEGFQTQASKGGKRVDSIRLLCNMVQFQFPLTLFFLTILNSQVLFVTPSFPVVKYHAYISSQVLNPQILLRIQQPKSSEISRVFTGLKGEKITLNKYLQMFCFPCPLSPKDGEYELFSRNFLISSTCCD